MSCEKWEWKFDFRYDDAEAHTPRTNRSHGRVSNICYGFRGCRGIGVPPATLGLASCSAPAPRLRSLDQLSATTLQSPLACRLRISKYFPRSSRRFPPPQRLTEVPRYEPPRLSDHCMSRVPPRCSWQCLPRYADGSGGGNAGRCHAFSGGTRCPTVKSIRSRCGNGRMLVTARHHQPQQERRRRWLRVKRGVCRGPLSTAKFLASEIELPSDGIAGVMSHRMRPTD